jgi:hypothetical protein
MTLDASSFAGLTAPVLELVIWNIQKTTNDPVFGAPGGTPRFNSKGVFFLTTPVTNMTDGMTDPSVFQGRAIFPTGAAWDNANQGWRVSPGGAGTPLTVGVRTQVTTLCVGNYVFFVNAKNWPGGAIGSAVQVGLLWRIIDTGAPAPALPTISPGGASATFTNNEWWPIALSTPLSANVAANFAKYKYMLKAMTLEVSGDTNLFSVVTPRLMTMQVTTQSGSPAVWGASSGPSYTIGSNNGLGFNQVSYTDYMVDYNPNGANAVDQTVMTASAAVTGTIQAGSYDWTTVGPFVDVTLSIPSVTEFPMLQTSTSVSVSPSPNDNSFSDIFMIMTSNQDIFEHAVFISSATAGSFNGTTGTISNLALPTSSVTVSSLAATPTTLQTRTSITGAQVFVPTHMATIYLLPNPIPTMPLGGSASVASLPISVVDMPLIRPYVYFVRFQYNGLCSLNSAIVDVSSISAVAQYTASALTGECHGHHDCTSPSGAHPASSRASLSANGDVTRFSSCLMYVNSTGMGTSVPSTKCMECSPGATNNLECRGGQFCGSDLGLCTVSGGTAAYVCDSEVSSWYGVCRNKTMDALGKRCRTVHTSIPIQSPVSHTLPGAGSTLNPGAAGAVFPSLLSDQGFAPGSGFCGEVRYFNATGNGASGFYSNTPATFMNNNTARSVLWVGSCFNGMCYECDPTASTSTTGGYLNCLNGQLHRPVTVDGTVRTLLVDSRTSAIVALCFFVLFLLFAQLISMQNDTNRHREHFGVGPMSCLEVLWAVTCGWLCCCKKHSVRSRSYGATSTPPASGSTTNPLEKAAEW